PGHEKANDHDSDAACIPANTADKGWVQPHSKLVERQSHTESVQQGNPRPGSVASKHESKVAGDHKNEDPIDVVVDVQCGNGLPRNPWKEHAESSRGRNTQEEGCCDAGWRSF